MINQDIQALKASIGENAANIIAQGIGLQNYNSRIKKGLCPFHNEKTPSFSWDKKHNRFKCFGCGETIDIIDYYIRYEHMTFFQAVEKIGGTSNVSHQIATKPTRIYSKPTHSIGDTNTRAYDYLGFRGISSAVCDYAGIKQSPGGNIIFEFKDEKGEIACAKYRITEKPREGQPKTRFAGKDTRLIPYMMDKVDVTKPVLITEGEIDCLSAIEAGFYNAISIPNGSQNLNWIDEVYEWLENIEEFIIWTDNDDAGIKCAEQLKLRLGKNRCRIATGLENDINDQLLIHGKESILETIKAAQYEQIQGVGKMVDISRENKDSEIINTRFPSLDKKLQGLHSGTLTILTGVNSSGKSTVANQMFIAESLERNIGTFVFSGELVETQLRDWIEFPLAGNSHIVGKEVNGYNTFYVERETGEKIANWYKDKLYYSTERTISPSDMLERMKLLYKRNGVRMFFIDNLMMLKFGAYGNEVYRMQSDFVESLSSFAKEYNCWVVLVAHPRKNDGFSRLTKMDIGGSGDITNLADYVFSVHRVKESERQDVVDKQGNVLKSGYLCDTIIDCFKNRPKGFQDFEVELYFNYCSKRFNETKNFGWEYGWKNGWVDEAIERFDEGELFI